MLGAVFKAKIGELEEEVREGFLRRFRKELTGVVQLLSRNNRFVVRFQDGCEKYLTLNQLTVVIVENNPVKEESKVPMITEISYETVRSDKGYYNDVG